MTLLRKTLTAFAVLVAALSLSAASGVAAPAMATARSTLAVVIIGPGSVTSSPAGISCPSKCAATFAYGTTVLLSPTPAAGYKFVRWGLPCAGGATCRVKLTSSLVSVAARFVAGPDPQPQPVRTKSIAAAGSYSAGGNSDYDGFSFFVSPGGTSLLNISVDSGVTCSPAGSFPGSNQIVIPSVAIAPNGTFVGSATDKGVFDNADAKFNYFFAGHLKGATSAGPPTAAGTLRQDIVFAANGTRETCTSNLQSWAATHDPQPAPARTEAVAGSYSAGGNSDYDGFSFFVSPGGANLLNVAVDAGLECTPAGSFPGSNQIVISNVAIAANGSFGGTAIEHGVFDNANAEFTYSFAGYFEGATPAAPRPWRARYAKTSCSPPMAQRKRARQISNPGWRLTTRNRPRRGPKPCRAVTRPVGTAITMALRSLFRRGACRTSRLTPASSVRRQVPSQALTRPSSPTWQSPPTARSAGRQLSTVSSTTPTPSSPTRSPGTSKGPPPPGLRP